MDIPFYGFLASTKLDWEVKMRNFGWEEKVEWD